VTAFTLTTDDGDEIRVKDAGSTCDGEALFDLEACLTIAQLVALASYLARHHCPESMEQAESDARTLHEWWRNADQFRVMEET
jgi:hypothetical protein